VIQVFPAIVLAKVAQFMTRVLPAAVNPLSYPADVLSFRSHQSFLDTGLSFAALKISIPASSAG
jgi:hypothetical protein